MLPVLARGLEYRYPSGRRGVEGLDLEVGSGELVALIGPNGSGKTTVLRLLGGELTPTAGRVTLFGESDLRAPAVRARLGVVPDHAPHFEPLTARENGRFFAWANGARGPAAEGAIDSLLADFDLLEEAWAPAGAFSFGMQRKLALSEALAHGPSLLLLDEPFIGLDPPAIEALVRILTERVRSGTAVVLATNELEPVPGLATRTVFLHEGRKVADASPCQLLQELGGGTLIEVRTPSGEHRFEPEQGALELPRICQELLDAGDPPQSIRVREPGLAEVFRRLTGVDLDGSA